MNAIGPSLYCAISSLNSSSLSPNEAYNLERLMPMAGVKSSREAPSYPFSQKTRMAASNAAASEDSRGRPIFTDLIAPLTPDSMHFYTIQFKKGESNFKHGTSELYGSKLTGMEKSHGRQTGRESRTGNGRQQRDWAGHGAAFRERRSVCLHHRPAAVRTG